MSTATFNNVANEKGEYSLPTLGFSYDALEPVIDTQTVEIHYSKHHQTYVNNLNAAIAKHPELAKQSIEELLVDLNKVPDDIRTAVRNHGGGHANHSLYWSVLTSKEKSGSPSKDLLTAIEKQYVSFDGFKDQLSKLSIGTFGSGWGWLTVKPNGELCLESTSNQDSPISKGNTPILVIDVWEHAYYLKYQNKRPDYVQAIFSIINWENVSLRYDQAIKSLKN
ncbi:MAG: superoxide dismutase [Candidatus Caenarcaniphilales bacterium]|nr:superoxide dismutase [Candidatus Caenarcaniphilales bacterium]